MVQTALKLLERLVAASEADPLFAVNQTTTVDLEPVSSDLEPVTSGSAPVSVDSVPQEFQVGLVLPAE